MASGIPVLNNNQMQRFREILGQNRKIDLTNKLTAKNHRLPTIPGEEPEATVSADGQIIITISNTTNATFPAGGAVAVDVAGQTMSAANVYPAKKINTSVNNPFGVCLEEIAAGATGDCLIFGLAEVTISGSSGLFAKPAASGNFTRGDEGVRIMGIASGTKAVVMLGDYYEAPVTPPSPGGGDVPPGTVIAYAGPLDYMPGEFYGDQYFPDGYSGQGNIPDGWLHCHGQAVSRTTYAALFAAIGTVYGQGDGSTTFNVPDFRGSFLRGAGRGEDVAYSVVGCSVVEDEETPGEYVDAGYCEIVGNEIESGEAVISGQTVNLAGGIFTTSGIILNGTAIGYGDISLNDNVIEVSGVGYINGFIPFSDYSYEGQNEMGKYLHHELPNMRGSFWGITLGPEPDGGTPYIQNPGPFINHDGTSGQGILPFPITQSPSYPPYATGLMITSYPNYDTFDNVQIFGSTSGYANSYKTNVSVTRYDFEAYYGQQIGVGNATTVADYIQKYGSPPPEEMLYIRERFPSGETVRILPTRHIIHWLIKY